MKQVLEKAQQISALCNPPTIGVVDVLSYEAPLKPEVVQTAKRLRDLAGLVQSRITEWADLLLLDGQDLENARLFQRPLPAISEWLKTLHTFLEDLCRQTDVLVSLSHGSTDLSIALL